jgi:hypothetical protein
MGRSIKRVNSVNHGELLFLPGQFWLLSLLDPERKICLEKTSKSDRMKNKDKMNYCRNELVGN